MALALAPAAVAQCAELNGSGGTLQDQSLPNEYCFGFKAKSRMTVHGFELFTQSTDTTPRRMTCALYRQASAAPPTPSTTPAATGTMLVGTEPGFYMVALDTPVTVQAEQSFWISQHDSSTIRAAGLTSGTAPAVPTFYRRPAGSGGWLTSSRIKFPSWRVHCTPISPPCLLYYKFDRGLGDVAVNYGTETVASKIIRGSKGPQDPWVSPGQYGGAMLRGARADSVDEFAACDTGFRAGLRGDLTVHWWMKERHAPSSTNPAYVFDGMSGFRCFSGGATAKGNLRIRGINGKDEILMPSVGESIQVRARAFSGVCVGCVVRTTAGVTLAQWYVDGTAHGSPIVLSAPPAVPADTKSLKIGTSEVPGLSSVWDIDEFRLAGYAAPATLIREWCKRPTAEFGSFGTQCGIRLGSTGGVPFVGNTRYAHTIEATPAVNTNCLFVVGISRKSTAFDMGIAFPALAGCTWFAPFDLSLVIATGPDGAATIPGAVPKSATIAGLQVITQVLGFQGAGNVKPLQSNAVSHAIEMR